MHTPALPTASLEFHNTSFEWVTSGKIKENEPRTDRPGQDTAGSRGQSQAWEINETAEWSKASEPVVTKALGNSQKSWGGHWISYRTWAKNSKPILFQSLRTVWPQLTSGWWGASMRRVLRCHHTYNDLFYVCLPHPTKVAVRGSYLTSPCILVPSSSRHIKIFTEWFFFIFFCDQNLRWISKETKGTKIG